MSESVRQHLAIAICVAVCTLVACYPLFFSGLPHGNDIGLELIRLTEYQRALADGQLPPRWAENLEGGFGYPIFNFFPHVFLMLVSGLMSLRGLCLLSESEQNRSRQGLPVGRRGSTDDFLLLPPSPCGAVIRIDADRTTRDSRSSR